MCIYNTILFTLSFVIKKIIKKRKKKNENYRENPTSGKLANNFLAFCKNYFIIMHLLLHLLSYDSQILKSLFFIHSFFFSNPIFLKSPFLISHLFLVIYSIKLLIHCFFFSFFFIPLLSLSRSFFSDSLAPLAHC